MTSLSAIAIYAGALAVLLFFAIVLAVFADFRSEITFFANAFSVSRFSRVQSQFRCFSPLQMRLSRGERCLIFFLHVYVCGTFA